MIAMLSPAFGFGQQSFHVLALYTTAGERDHVDFAEQAVKFYSELAKKDNFSFEASTNWDLLAKATPDQYQVVLWFNDMPHAAEQRAGFQRYMEAGGAWMGFHFAGYNDESTHWPWFVDFLGAVFYGNNWPPLPAKLIVDDRQHAATRRLPATYMAPPNEWYSWAPDPRANKSIKVLLTLSPENYPLGLKDTLTGGDVPVVWTNTKYKMIYSNMGHGDKIFDSPTQNLFFEDALLSLGRRH
jgi:type 1 glutamine amidotransferase